ncbi:hypothetical protein [Paenibacillus sp. FSL H8-0034]|uniref:hypothetical protein n=1 Tax=Paenibacillus sp. FSL H8-0034 TaxID=2954671 RepID=UPI0030FC8BDE
MKTYIKRYLVGAGILVAAIAISMVVKIEVIPPDHTRLILERSSRVFISPPCFNQAVISNNLSESTLKKAKELEYIADSACTEQSLTAVHKSLLLACLEQIGLSKGNWNW